MCIKSVILFFCIVIGCIQAQAIEPSKLKYNHKKLLSRRSCGMAYSGEVKGLLFARESINIANIRVVVPSLNTLQTIPMEEERQHIEALYLVGYIEKGKETGTWQYYMEGNVLLIEANFVNGIINGKFVVYYSNGNMESCEMYRDGKRDGIAVTYNKSGEITGKFLYKDDCFIRSIPEGEW